MNVGFTSVPSDQEILNLGCEEDRCTIQLRSDGTIQHMQLAFSEKNWVECAFRSDQLSGPKWDGVTITLVDKPHLRFEGEKSGIRYSLQYEVVKNILCVTAGLKNIRSTPFSPKAARLIVGIDTEMIRYPEWRKKFFPTLLRAEKTHFWGYFMSPEGRILAISSPSPIASWNYEFQPKEHRIYTVSLDMLHALPLPPRHPQNLTSLEPGEERNWPLFLQPVDKLEAVKPTVAKTIHAPMIEIDRYTLADGENANVTIFSNEDVDVVADHAGKEIRVTISEASASVFHAKYNPRQGVGLYKLKVRNSRGKISEAMVYVRHPWSWYMKQARKEAIRIPQKASTHAESWLGHFSNYLARRYFPDDTLDTVAEHNFRTILALMFDINKAEPILVPGRIQNTYYMISLLVDVYRATGNIGDLELAGKLGDWLMTRQANDGSYRADYGGHGAHYTCVAYGAKSMLELAAAEKALGEKQPVWREQYGRHFASAQKAVEDLAMRLDSIGTEGQATYEDGMIGSSATQLAMMSLLVEDEEKRNKFLAAAQYMFAGHRCLDQMLVPDCRINGGTLRFWEAQYDVMIPRNMMNSPHGWTAWCIPGFYYMYQLTGEEIWLRRAMNSLGACVQLIDVSGKLRWAFVQDPYIRASVLHEDPDNPASNEGKRTDRIIAEQYVDMISHFYHPPLNNATGGHWGEGGSCDNDVHEVFKALEEVALSAAYIVERANGEVIGYNCKVNDADGTLTITPSENVISRLHLNLRTKLRVSITFGGGSMVSGEFSGMKWIGPGGIPEDLR